MERFKSAQTRRSYASHPKNALLLGLVVILIFREGFIQKKSIQRKPVVSPG